MKQLLIASAILAAGFAQANQQVFEGQFERNNGAMFLKASSQNVELKGIDFSTDSIQDGSLVKVSGLSQEDQLEVHEFSVKTDDGYKNLYSWKETDEDLYDE